MKVAGPSKDLRSPVAAIVHKKTPPTNVFLGLLQNVAPYFDRRTKSSNKQHRQDATQKGGEIKRKVVSLLISHQYKLYIHRNINHSRKCRKISRQPIFAESSTSCSAKCCSAIPCFRPGLPPWSRLPVEDFSDTAESLQTV